MVGGNDQPDWENRAQFFGAAGKAMQRILVGQSQRRKALRRGGDCARIELGETEIVGPKLDSDEVLALNDALERFAEVDPDEARLVQPGNFVGFKSREPA